MAVMDWEMLDKSNPDYISDEEMSIPGKNNEVSMKKKRIAKNCDWKKTSCKMISILGKDGVCHFCDYYSLDNCCAHFKKKNAGSNSEWSKAVLAKVDLRETYVWSDGRSITIGHPSFGEISSFKKVSPKFCEDGVIEGKRGVTDDNHVLKPLPLITLMLTSMSTCLVHFVLLTRLTQEQTRHVVSIQ